MGAGSMDDRADQCAAESLERRGGAGLAAGALASRTVVEALERPGPDRYLANGQPGAHLVRTVCQTAGDAGATLAALALLLGRPAPLTGGSRAGHPRSGVDPGSRLDWTSAVGQGAASDHECPARGLFHSPEADALEYLLSARGDLWRHRNLTLIGRPLRSPLLYTSLPVGPSSKVAELPCGRHDLSSRVTFTSP